MANLIRLKQIESGSQLSTAASVGQDFSQSVFEIIDGAGLISSSAQVLLISASGYNQLATDLEVSVISSSIAATISVVAAGTGFVTTGSFHAYTSSLGNTFATDQEVYLTASAIIDQGEF
jgi:hypothetical protein